jgi:hypothetical protein
MSKPPAIPWEYHFQPISPGQKPEHLQSAVNDLGALGWELIFEYTDGDSRYFIFKRMVLEEA